MSIHDSIKIIVATSALGLLAPAAGCGGAEAGSTTTGTGGAGGGASNSASSSSSGTGGGSTTSSTSTSSTGGGSTSSTGGSGGAGGAPCVPSPEVCDGVDNDCDGQIDEGCECVTGETKSCYDADPATKDVGACKAGTRTCDANGKLGACEGQVTPAAESCNGIDDDCNGVVDDGLPSATCGLGACQVTMPTCVNGAPNACVPLPPSPAETCNGIDDDCDGQVDEGCPCMPGQTQSCYPGPPGTAGVGPCKAGIQACDKGNWGACQNVVLPGVEVCDGIDNDCNGAVDDGLAPLSCGVGACAVTTPSCVGGVPQSPQSCVPKAASPEVCDGIDNDCNGAVDDGLAPLSCGLGACANTAPACVGGMPGSCAPKAASPEVCDGIDNDCNGVVDDAPADAGQPCQTGAMGVCAAGIGACQGGALVCAPLVQPSAETCNGQDDDCNGVADDIAPGDDPSNCGACGAVCASINGTGTCAAGKCTLACSPGFADCDGDPANGCEADLSAPGTCGACNVVCGAGTTCGTTVAETMAAQPAGWQFNGNASWDATGKVAVVTTTQANVAGTLFYKNPIVTDAFSVTFSFRIGGGSGADGLIYAIQSNGATALGATGGAFGVGGFPGWGFELDTYKNGSCDANANHAAFDTLASCGLNIPTALTTATNLPFALRNTGWHTAVATVSGGAATLVLDGTTVINAFPIPGWAGGGTYYHGFGAGTGGLTDRHEVKDVTITFPSPRCL